MILGGYLFIHFLFLISNLFIHILPWSFGWKPQKICNSDSIFIWLVNGHCILKMCNPDELLMLHNGNRDKILFRIWPFHLFVTTLDYWSLSLGYYFIPSGIDNWLDYLKCIIFITLIKWLHVSSSWVGFDGPWVSNVFFFVFFYL